MINYYIASMGKKFVAFMIDMAVVLGITYVAGIIFSSVYYDSSNLTLYISDFLTAEENYLNQLITNNEFMDETYKFLGYIYPLLIVTNGVELIAIVVLMVILPYYTSFQTLGRAAMRIKVVNYPDEAKPSIPRLLLREIIGTYILLPLCLLFCYGLPLLIIIPVSRKSIPDLISTTVTIDLARKEFVLKYAEENKEAFAHQQNFENSIRADFKEVNKEDNPFRNDYQQNDYSDKYHQDTEKAQDEPENKSDDNDDEYTVF